MESTFTGLSFDEEEEEILQVQGDTDSVSDKEILSLVGCFLTASIIHYATMKSTMANLWHPTFNNHLLILHKLQGGRSTKSFINLITVLGVEVDSMGWDLSLRAQSRRAQAMSSVWLREEGGSGGRMIRRGFNLEGKRLSSQLERVRTLIDNNQMAMDHDLENKVVIGEEGKKRVREDIEE
ncbi:hypothetical protein Gogos_021002, partial [Gossypium gossypioides]|nr:hypothetical protein [Gossypium gossypioides]